MSVRKRPAAAKAGGDGEEEDQKYKSVNELWSSEVRGEAERKSWYSGGASYWQKQEASINGVLGGFPETHEPDIRESRRFLSMLRKSGALSLKKGQGDALDCGAGIGRVTGSLLRHEFACVDLVEPNKRLLGAAQKEFAKDKRVRHFMASPLQTAEIPPDSYDVIWIQWVLLYLPEDDLLAFLHRCKKGLRRHGMILVKENVVLRGSFEIDREDNSVSRTDAEYKAVFKRAGLSLDHTLKQTCWPPELIPVMMYALRPSDAEAPPPRKRPAAASLPSAAPALKRPAGAR